jgi:hypothetical protein
MKCRWIKVFLSYCLPLSRILGLTPLTVGMSNHFACNLSVYTTGSQIFWFAAHCKTCNHFLAQFVYKFKNILIYFKPWIKVSIQMGSFLFLKYTFIIFEAHLATSWGAPLENHWSNQTDTLQCTHQASIRSTMFLQNVGSRLLDYTVSRSRKTTI